jgi:hypothetical protein
MKELTLSQGIEMICEINADILIGNVLIFSKKKKNVLIFSKKKGNVLIYS